MDNITNIESQIKVEPSEEIGPHNYQWTNGLEDYNIQGVQDGDVGFETAPYENVVIKEESSAEISKLPPPRKYPCSECDLVFDTISKRLYHTLMAHRVPRFECKDCGQKFHYLPRLLNHARVHESGTKKKGNRKQQKPRKPKPTKTKRNKKVILEDTVTNISNEITLEDTELQLKDDQKNCTKSIGTENDEKNTVANIKTEITSGDTVLKKPKRRKKYSRKRFTPQRYACPVCKTMFASKYKMHYHKVHHEDPKFQCYVCEKKFYLEYMLTNHVKQNNCQEKPKRKENLLECRICELVFDTLSKRTHHQVVAHGEPKFVCDICGKKFFYKNNLTNHVFIHDPARQRVIEKQKMRDKEPQLECKVCGKKFCMEYNLINHKKRNDCQRQKTKPKMNLRRRKKVDKQVTPDDTTIDIKTEIVLEDTELSSQDPLLETTIVECDVLPFESEYDEKVGYDDNVIDIKTKDISENMISQDNQLESSTARSSLQGCKNEYEEKVNSDDAAIDIKTEIVMENAISPPHDSQLESTTVKFIEPHNDEEISLDDTITNIDNEITLEDTELQPKDGQKKPRKSKYSTKSTKTENDGKDTVTNIKSETKDAVLQAKIQEKKRKRIKTKYDTKRYACPVCEKLFFFARKNALP